jgi:hypothetical protein
MPWEHLAGALMIEEASGKIARRDGRSCCAHDVGQGINVPCPLGYGTRSRELLGNYGPASMPYPPRHWPGCTGPAIEGNC